MSNYEIITKEVLSNVEAADVISKKAKIRELTYREEKVSVYLKSFQKLSLKDFNKAKEDLTALELARVDSEQIIKILDLMPNNGTELRAIVSHSGVIIVDENVDKVLSILKKYRK